MMYQWKSGHVSSALCEESEVLELPEHSSECKILTWNHSMVVEALLDDKVKVCKQVRMCVIYFYARPALTCTWEQGFFRSLTLLLLTV